MPRVAAHPDEYQQLRQRTMRGARFTEGTHRDGGVLPWHTHDAPTLCLVLQGRFAEYSSGHVADCRGTSLKFMPAGERHWNRFHQGDVRGFMGEFESARFALDPQVNSALERQAQFMAGPEVDLARRLYAEFRRDDFATPVAMEGLLLELLAQLARRAEKIRPGDRPAWAMRAMELVRAHAAFPLSVSTIAESVGVNPATLARGFRASFGCSISDMQRQARLELAVADLSDPEHSLAEVALRAGFYDQSHFTNLFRRAYGTTPARYRRELLSA